MMKKKLTELKPYPQNAKKHPEEQIKKIANSIREFGFNQQIVIDKDDTIIVGHGRYEAAKLLKLEDVPVLQVDLTEEQAKAYRLADNKLNESDWEMELVIEELKGLSAEMIDITGFDQPLDIEGLGTDFELPDGEKAPVQEMRFVLSDDQTEAVKQTISEIRKTDEFKHCETFGNENGNGNALYLICQQWDQQRK